MLTPTFSWIIAAFSGVVGVLLLAGKGTGILNALSSKSQREEKKTPEQQKAQEIGIGIFLLILCADEILMALFATKYRWMPFLNIAIIIAGMVIAVLYIRKHS